jgi:hypothetical protein
MYKPNGVILDLTDLEYEWGDMMEYVFGIGTKLYHPRTLPKALVVGDKCIESIGTLIHGLYSKTPPTTEDWIFDALEEAWVYVENMMK